MDIPLFISIPTISALAIFSALFSASETAFIGASKGHIHAQAKQGDARARLVKTLRKDMEKVIGSLLLGNTMANLLAASLTTSLFTELFGGAGVVYAMGLMTVVIIIYAEVVPKFYAVNRPETTARALAPFLRIMFILFSPFTRVIEWIARKTLTLFGVDIDPRTHITSSLDELRGAIDLHPGDSREGREERAMLHSILDLSDVTVGEIVIHRQEVVGINASSPPSEILEQVISSPYTRLPLWKDQPENIVGVLHAKDFLRSIQSHRKDIDEIDILKVANEPWFIPETTPLIHQLHAFRQKKEHFALVVDEYGGWIGAVTLEDILEEIVGEIRDEHDVSLAGVWLAKNGDVFAPGTTTLRDLNRQFQWDLPDEEAVTIAGLVLHEAQKIPLPGQVFHIENFRIKVIQRVRNQVTRVRITPPRPEI